MPQPTRVVVIDDIVDIRDLLRVQLELEDDIVVVGEGGDGRTAIAVAREQQPDVMILDMMMPELTGLDALPEIKRVSPGTAVILFSSRKVRDEADAAGADAYIEKPAPAAELVDLVREVAAARR